MSIRTFRMLSLALLLVATLAPAARAGDGDDGEVPRPLWDDSDPEEGMGPGMNPLLEPCPTDYPWGIPTREDITYKTFANDEGGTTPILLDQYSPPTLGLGPQPAVVLAHGGGWLQGCRRALNRAAVDLAQTHHFIVYSIDYRLSCTAADNPSPDEAPLCNWKYPRIDPVTGTRGAAIHDVQDAVSWVRANAASHYPNFNGKVALAGSSAGANLVFQAAGVLSSGDPRRPEAVGGWSSNNELGRMTNGEYTCDESPNYNYCWTGVKKYQDCDIRDGDPGCASRYTEASPRPTYTSSGPPVFIANADDEIMPLLQATDLRDWLDLIQPPVVHFFCEVDNSQLHGKGYLFPKGCNGVDPPIGPSVLQQNVSFFRSYVGGS
jgi:acetyl esterase/lipase